MSDLEHARSLLEMARGDLNSLRGKRWSGLIEQQRWFKKSSGPEMMKFNRKLNC
jgi:hypothetical protein